MTQTDSITLKSHQHLPAITLMPDNQTSVVLLSVRLWTARETDARHGCKTHVFRYGMFVMVSVQTKRPCPVI